MSGAALFRTSDFLSARFLTTRSTSKISIRNFGLIVLRLTVPRQKSESTELHTFNNVTVLPRKLLIVRVDRHFGEGQAPTRAQEANQRSEAQADESKHG